MEGIAATVLKLFLLFEIYTYSRANQTGQNLSILKFFLNCQNYPIKTNRKSNREAEQRNKPKLIQDKQLRNVSIYSKCFAECIQIDSNLLNHFLFEYLSHLAMRP